MIHVLPLLEGRVHQDHVVGAAVVRHEVSAGDVMAREAKDFLQGRGLLDH